MQELFGCKKGAKTLAQHYANLNKATEELKTSLPITSNMKQIQHQWSKLMVLTFFSEHTHARSQVTKDIQVSTKCCST